MDAMLYPNWFMEGTASLAAGNCRFYDYAYRKLGFMDPDGTAPSCTPDGVRRVYTEKVENLYGDKGFDDIYASYLFGSVAVAWLSDMQRQADGHPSAVTRGADGSVAIDGEGILDGFSRILERLHNGEPLDDIIRRVTGARFLDTEDFSLRFIQGGEDEAALKALVERSRKR